MQIKTTLRFRLTEWLRSKIQVTANAGEDVEKKEHSSIVGGIASLYKLIDVFCFLFFVFFFFLHGTHFIGIPLQPLPYLAGAGSQTKS